ncbi:hypothetical protein N2152v2_006925 [Parachlorella kessleri]
MPQVVAAAQQQEHHSQTSDAAQPTAVAVTFKLQRKIKYGQSHAVVGNHPSLGKWKVSRAPQMGWSEGDTWQTEVSLPPGTALEFKCVRISNEGGEVKWEEGPNHVLTVPSNGVAQLAVEIDWGSQAEATAQQAQQGASQGAGPEGGADVSSETANNGGPTVSSSFEERLPTEGWQGRKTRFMQNNEHSREREGGVWNTEGLQGSVLALVEGDRDNGSWLGKLAVLKRLLVDSAPRQRPDLDAVASAYIYTQWISTGAIPCVESGGHQRPNRHAELSRLMFRSLEWVIEDAGKPGGSGDSDSNSRAAVGLVARRLHTRLPSFTEQFTQSVPLTRIRDIAHRNDIPQDLKRELKHTIQNKLHRNAGPEDLVATEEVLQRITAQPGQYSQAFVEEFKKFTAELRDFFNAGSLSDMLAEIKPLLDEPSGQLVDRFLGAKGTLDASGQGANQNQLMDALHGVTSVRALLASSLSSGLRNDAPDKAMAMRQRYRLCEVRTEDYAFVLLSRFINMLEEKGGAGALAGGNDGTWALPLGALVLGLRHVGLGGFQLGECMAVERELTAWQKAGQLVESKDNALRLRATLLRLQRLTETYCAVLVEAYAQRAKQLGTALGLDPYLVTVFPEAEIRASVVFQLSKLCTMLLRATGMVAGGLDDWEVIVGGEARGVLIEAKALEPGCLDAAHGKAAVVLVREATGDEEVSALGSGLKGVILRQAIPHLSHLGVRARQEQVPFVCCEDEQLLAETAEPLLGKQVLLKAGTEGASICEDSGPPEAGNGGSSSNGASQPGIAPVAKPSSIEKVTGAMRVVPLEDATSATCGAKAAACGELVRLAKQCHEILSSSSSQQQPGGASAAAGRQGSGSTAGSSKGRAAAAVGNEGNGGTPAALFQAPEGVCLPFGCMELAIKSDGKSDEFEGLLRRVESEAGQALEEACHRLQQLVKGLRIPQQVLQQLSGSFNPGATLIVRSSSNVEDLAGMSGAGLYDSIPNVPSGDLGALQAAICGVWASLYTRRAVLSRKTAGVAQGSASMAVAVQPMLAPELSFVLHTAHPISRDPDVLEAELAPGLGETLAAGTRGSGWRLEIQKPSGAVATRSFANFTRALLPAGARPGAENGTGAQEGGSDEAQAQAGTASGGGSVQLQLVDYSQQPMSVSEEVRGAVGRRLTAVGRLLEHEFGGAQDVEGCFAGGELWVVQSRPQP